MSKEILIPKQKPFINLNIKSYGNNKFEAKLCLHFVAKDDNNIKYTIKLNYDIKRAEAEREKRKTESEDDIILDISVIAKLKAVTEEQDSEAEEFQAKWSVYLESYLGPFDEEYGYSYAPSKAEIEHTNFGKKQEWLNKYILRFPTAIVVPIKFECLKIPTLTYCLSYDEDDNWFDDDEFE